MSQEINEDTRISNIIGKVRRTYSKEDFNPFAAIDYIYNHCLSSGEGHVVSVIGHSERFQNDIVRAFQHVLVHRGIISKDDPIPIPNKLGEVQAVPSKTTLRFVCIPDSPDHQSKFIQTCKESSYVALCNKYESPIFKNVIREKSQTIPLYDFSRNNV
jgi:hypothetical protein